MGIFLKDFFAGNFWEKFFGRIFRRIFGRIVFFEEFFGRNYSFNFTVEGIDLFVKILVFIKILSKSRKRKEGGQNLDP